MKPADLATAALLMLLGAIVIFDSLRLGIGWGSDGPRSGFFPFWLAVVMIACCLGIIAQALRRKQRGTFVTREQLKPVLWVLVPAAVFVLLTGGFEAIHLPALGLYVSAGLYLAFYMRSIGRHSWFTVLIFAVGIPIVTFLVFEQWFLVPMPKGPLEQWLGY